MIDLPEIIDINHLRHYWYYRNGNNEVIGIVVRYEKKDSNGQKWFRQYHIDGRGEWTEGAPTPLPIFGIETLPSVKNYSNQKVYIFEGEKCAFAVQSLDLPALTSMRGANQAHLADWSILARYRHIQHFILVPDNDVSGQSYISSVHGELKKACPCSKISVCQLPYKNKGEDIVDWFQLLLGTEATWDGFSPIDDPFSNKYLQRNLEAYVNSNLIDAKEYFSVNTINPPIFSQLPIAFDSNLRKVLDCPVDTLPPLFKDLIERLTLQMQMPVDYLVITLLIHIGSLIGRKRALRLRPREKWMEYPNLWGIIIGNPAAMKSPAMQAISSLFKFLEKSAEEEYQQKREKFETDNESWKIRKKNIEEEYKRSHRENLKQDDNSRVELKTKLPEYSIEDAPKAPTKKRYTVKDVTVEKLMLLLSENPQGLLVHRDELSAFLRSFDKPGRENDRQFFLECWSAKEDFCCDRIMRGSIRVPSLCISIIGAMTPGTLAEYVRHTVKGGLGDDGLMQRFQLMVYPDLKNKWEKRKDTTTTDLEEPIKQAIAWLDSLSFYKAIEPVIMTFSEEAQVMFDQWQETHENRLRNSDLPSYFESHLAKYKKLLPALCIILSQMYAACGYIDQEKISADIFQIVLRWLAYLESHAIRIYEMDADTTIQAAQTLLQKIKQSALPNPFTIRDVYYGRHWCHLTNQTQVSKTIDYLVEKGFLIGQSISTRGRPTIKYWVHPSVFDN